MQGMPTQSRPQKEKKFPLGRQPDQDSDSDSDLRVENGQPSSTEVIARREAEREAYRNKPRPFSGQGKKLSEVIKECWRGWTEMMIADAKADFTEAQVQYAMALWRGDKNAGIEQNRREGFRWMNRAVSRGRHDIFSKGGCGPANCHKCSAMNHAKKMAE